MPPSVSFDHFGAMGWRRLVWVGQSGRRPGGRDWPLEVATTGAMPRVQWPSEPGRPPLPGDGSVTAICPVDYIHLGPANGGVTEDWGQDVLKIKEDLTRYIPQTSLKVSGSFHVKSPKKCVILTPTPSISAKIGEPIAPHDRKHVRTILAQGDLSGQDLEVIIGHDFDL